MIASAFAPRSRYLPFGPSTSAFELRRIVVAKEPN